MYEVPCFGKEQKAAETAENKEGGKEDLDNLIETAKSAEERAREMIKEEWKKTATEFQKQMGEDETKFNISELKQGIEIFRNYQKIEPEQVEVTMNLINNLTKRTSDAEDWQKMLEAAREIREVIAEKHKNTVDGEEKIIPEMHRKLLRLAEEEYCKKCYRKYGGQEVIYQVKEIIK